MAQAYIYMECPVSGQTLTLGKLTIQSGVGTFQYSPDAVQENIWVPDPFRYPLSARSYSVTKNGGVPGFIDDAMPDGWGERLLHRVEKGPLDSIQLLLKSPNGDRAGNIMAGTARVPQDGLGQTPPKALHAKGLDHFIDACEAIYDNQLSAEQLEVLKVRDQRSSAGGARPKRTYLFDKKLILAKPRDKFDHYDLPSVEHACMTFAGLKGLQVANTSLYRSERINTLLVERFDRIFEERTGRFRRLPMLSGLTLLDAEWKARSHPDWQYAALADELYRRGLRIRTGESCIGAWPITCWSAMPMTTLVTTRLSGKTAPGGCRPCTTCCRLWTKGLLRCLPCRWVSKGRVSIGAIC